MMGLENMFVYLPGILIGLTVHEYCHALAAAKLGDYTAQQMGRLTLNPLRHIDLVGLIFLVVAGFGWAKPVRFDPSNLKNPRRDKAIIAAAGPLSNFLMALVIVFLIRTCLLLIGPRLGPQSMEAFFGFIHVMSFAAIINLGLFVFNLIPIPPLDGSHIVFSSLNLDPQTERRIMSIGAPLLLVIILSQRFTGIDILPIGRITYAIFGFLMNSIF
ncbi:MAG: site-2 protease family protein [Treponema sp.]|nr:site-2 protease family protein [Treponema sp.]